MPVWRMLANGEVWARFGFRWIMPYERDTDYAPVAAEHFEAYAASIRAGMARTGREALRTRLYAVRRTAEYYAWPWRGNHPAWSSH